MLHIGLIWANPYSRNLGVGALAYSSLSLLQDVCNDNGIEADFTIIGSSGPMNDTITVNDKKISLTNITGNDHLKLRSLLKLALRPNKYNTKAILNLDVVFDISEGDSFTDIYGVKRFEKFLNSKMFFNLLKKRQILLPQTIGPFNDPINEKKAFAVMQQMNKVISRDKQSFEYTSRFLPGSKIMETIDVAFYLSFKRNQFDPAFQHVGINISGLLWNGGYTRKNQFNLKGDYKNLVEGIVAYFRGLPNVKLHFVSHVISRRNSVEDDYTVAAEFQSRYPETVVAPLFKTPVEAKNYISGLDFFMGSRMHACIAAFSSGVPVFPLAYSRKFNGLFLETLGYQWMGDCINETDEVIIANIKTAYSEKDKLKTELERIKNEVVKQRLDLVKDELLKSIRSTKTKSVKKVSMKNLA